MPNKLRVIVEIGETRRFGGQAKTFMQKSLPRRTNLPSAFDLWKKQTQLEWLFERVPGTEKKMWLFREPAKINIKHSAYKQKLRDWGFYDVNGEMRNVQRVAESVPQSMFDWVTLSTRLDQVTRRRTTPGPPVNPNPQNRRPRPTAVMPSVDYFGEAQW